MGHDALEGKKRAIRVRRNKATDLTDMYGMFFLFLTFEK